jgi:hypothetical protein
MKIIAEKGSKTDKYDRLRCVRSDGSESSTMMPRQGTLPHDLVHFVVESALPLQHGFLSLVAAGAEVNYAMKIVHDTTNENVKTQAVQAEAIVEALQTQLWAGYFNLDAFLLGVRSACAARNKPTFDFAGINAQEKLFEAALALKARWEQVPHRQNLMLEFVAG